MRKTDYYYKEIEYIYSNIKWPKIKFTHNEIALYKIYSKLYYLKKMGLFYNSSLMVVKLLYAIMLFMFTL